ncbi:MAG: hypothetical protein IPK83_20620 [Planctomycetes bacterium]|nr:hypothetical protein [Planctomycetota bacterium]
MRRTLILFSLSCLAIGNFGCMTAAKRMLKEAQGATSKSNTVPNGSRESYKGFEAVTASPSTSEVQPLVSTDFMKSLRIELINQLTVGDEPLFKKTGEPVVNIDSRVMWYHKPGAMGDILGNYSYTVVLYTMSSDGRTLDQVQIVTKSAASRTDDDDMAKSSVKELIAWFEARGKGRFEEDDEKERQEEADREKRQDEDDDD